jgi:hypothetical protein
LRWKTLLNALGKKKRQCQRGHLDLAPTITLLRSMPVLEGGALMDLKIYVN